MSTAVILAARKEREADIPFPLMPFGEGITLIDRTVEILRENYFTKIIIVAGYHAEMFRRFEADDVKIILNPDYEFMASLGSLMAAKDEITEDFLLIDGDTFFEKELIRRISSISSDNCLAITEESGSGDECFVETKHGFITKISKDRHRVCNFEGELIGVNRISLETFERMKELWNRSTNPLLNYEYALMDVTTPLDRPYIRFKNLIWGDVDTIKDFLILDNNLYRRLRRKENPFDEENLLKYVRNIFPNRNLSDCEITQIGGMSNKNFLVTINNQRFVLRVPGY
ncbi:MAG: NTP transferase domain-containing protein, partial [Muribaculaceae bacterium]|nr:NTP transferase domain-containing protein [Muribaculaceae bacterium]